MDYLNLMLWRREGSQMDASDWRNKMKPVPLAVAGLVSDNDPDFQECPALRILFETWLPYSGAACSHVGKNVRNLHGTARKFMRPRTLNPPKGAAKLLPLNRKGNLSFLIFRVEVANSLGAPLVLRVRCGDDGNGGELRRLS